MAAAGPRGGPSHTAKTAAAAGNYDAYLGPHLQPRGVQTATPSTNCSAPPRTRARERALIFMPLAEKTQFPSRCEPLPLLAPSLRPSLHPGRPVRSGPWRGASESRGVREGVLGGPPVPRRHAACMPARRGPREGRGRKPPFPFPRGKGGPGRSAVSQRAGRGGGSAAPTAPCRAVPRAAACWAPARPRLSPAESEKGFHFVHIGAAVWREEGRRRGHPIASFSAGPHRLLTTTTPRAASR